MDDSPTERAASAEPSLLEFCRVASEEDRMVNRAKTRHGGKYDAEDLLTSKTNVL